jgi:hypothetical protein
VPSVHGAPRGQGHSHSRGEGREGRANERARERESERKRQRQKDRGRQTDRQATERHTRSERCSKRDDVAHKRAGPHEPVPSHSLSVLSLVHCLSVFLWLCCFSHTRTHTRTHTHTHARRRRLCEPSWLSGVWSGRCCATRTSCRGTTACRGCFPAWRWKSSTSTAAPRTS